MDIRLQGLFDDGYGYEIGDSIGEIDK
jgi:hypothetical protein